MTRYLLGQKFYSAGQGPFAERELIPAALSDTVDLPDGPCHGIYVTGTGNIQVIINGLTVANVLQNVPANTLINVELSRIEATSTTATGIYAVYKTGGQL